MPYWLPLDGIRAVAILAVLVFHVSPEPLPGGFTGVDVFFVLSGFLITSITLQDLGTSTFSLKEFYLRRVQRLLPNALAMVLVTLLLWMWFAPPSASRQPAVHGLWTLVNLSNVYVWRELGGYWGAAAEQAPLTHTWSLAIEEQFYLLFPGTLLLLMRLQPGRVRPWLVGAILTGFAACVVGTFTRPAATFYLLPTRVWELLLGAGLAALRSPVAGGVAGRRFAIGYCGTQWAGWIGLLMVLLGFWVINEHASFPGVIALLPTVGTVLLLASVVEGESRVSRWLASRPMVFVGKRSYSLYLWHWPCITFGKLQAEVLGFSRLTGALLGVMGGIVLAGLAYGAIEQPLRRRERGRSWRLAAIAAGFVAVAATCSAVAVRRVATDPEGLFEPTTFSGKAYDTGRTADQDLRQFERYSDVRLPVVPASQRDCWRSGGVIHRHGGERPKVVVFGSSHAMAFSHLIDDLCRTEGIPVAFLAADNGTPAFFESKWTLSFSSMDDAREFNDARRRWLREWQPDVVFVIDRWDAHADDARQFDTSLRAFLEEVTPLVGRVALVAQVPTVKSWRDINLREYVLWRRGREQVLPRLMPDSKEALRQEIAAVAEAATRDYPKLRVLRPDHEFLLPDGSVRYALGRVFFYADDNHLSDAGAESVRGMFEEMIHEILH